MSVSVWKSVITLSVTERNPNSDYSRNFVAVKLFLKYVVSNQNAFFVSPEFTSVFPDTICKEMFYTLLGMGAHSQTKYKKRFFADYRVILQQWPELIRGFL